MVYIQRPQLQQPRVDLRHELRSEVGGFMGMGTSVANSVITFEKNQYYLGEEARFHIACDNSECAKDIKNFKFKLLRRSKGFDQNNTWSTTETKYLVAKKEPGIPKG